VDPRDFTILTLPARLRQVGDLWAGLRESKGVDLRGVLERAQGYEKATRRSGARSPRR
jgi:DNA primase